MTGTDRVSFLILALALIALCVAVVILTGRVHALEVRS